MTVPPIASTGKQALYWVRERDSISKHLEVLRLVGEEQRPTGSGANYERWYLVLTQERV